MAILSVWSRHPWFLHDVSLMLPHLCTLPLPPATAYYISAQYHLMHPISDSLNSVQQPPSGLAVHSCITWHLMPAPSFSRWMRTAISGRPGASSWFLRNRMLSSLLARWVSCHGPPPIASRCCCDDLLLSCRQLSAGVSCANV